MARGNTFASSVELEIDGNSDAGKDASLLLPRTTPRANARLTSSSSEHRTRRGLFTARLSCLGNGIVTTPAGISAVMCLTVFLWVMSGMVAMIPGMHR